VFGYVNGLTPSEKGAIAEAEIAAAATRAGIVVLRPDTDGRRYDLVFDTGPDLLRVQCKYAPRRGDVIVVRFRTSRYTPGRGYVRTLYTSDEIDAIAAYCPEVDRCYVIPIASVEGRGFMHLRLEPTRNCQASGVKWASQFEFGAIAQLGERVTGSHEVAGSSPASSTGPKAA
jgi:hypothetical protein